MPNFTAHLPERWLAFELSVLRRLRFRSLANPFAGEPDLDFSLKRWGVRVATNDAAQWAWIKAVARVENNTERLTDDDLDQVLEDVYVPRHRLHNPALQAWFGETDAWWFDNLRDNAEGLAGAAKLAVALDLGMMVGDYARSFDEATRELRQPLSRVFRRLRDTRPAPVNNQQTNTVHNQEAHQFLAEQQADLLFLRLPPANRTEARRDPVTAWREEWVRGSADFWRDYEEVRARQLGARTETRQQYLRHLEDLLRQAAHIKTWAISHVEHGLVSTEELVEIVRSVRKVETIYTKDFSELTGARAAIITA